MFYEHFPPAFGILKRFVHDISIITHHGRSFCHEVKQNDSMLIAVTDDGKYTFVSRGDASGTHTKELSLWPESLGITKEAESFANYTDWYVSANAGMGACLVMAEEMGAYILTDKATFLTFVANDGVMG